MTERAIAIAAPEGPRRRAGATGAAAIGLAAGLAVAGWAILHVGPAAIGAGLRAAGWTGLWAISAFHLIATTAMGLAWWRLRQTGKPAWFVWGRLVRDGGSEVLPLSQIGGYVLGARAVTTKGIAATTAGASLLVDMTIEFVAQIAYVVLGLALLAWREPQSPLMAPLLGALGILALAGGAIAALRRRGLPRWLARAPRLSWLKAAYVAHLAEFRRELAAIYGGRHTLWPSFLLHLAAWVVSGVEAWLALRLMGTHFSLATVLILESQVYAMRSLGFLVPGAIGVQEAAYVVASAGLGLPADLALGLSLLKRARDVTLGIPALLSWQWVEARRGWRRRPPAVVD